MRMPHLTYQSHFQFYYDSGAPFRSSKRERWNVQYGKCQRYPKNFREECLSTARLIAGQTDKEISVLFSGGIDSEVTLRSFVESGIPVQAVIARYKNDLNIHDISWAIIACEALNVPYKIFDLDLISFWEDKSYYYAQVSQCLSPQLTVCMWLADQISGYPVLGSGECLLVKDDETSIWSLWEKERIASWFRFFIAREREACPSFFQYTPELILSYILDPLIQDLISNPDNKNLLNSAEIKLNFYQQHFDILPRPKYTGFEKVQDEDFKYRSRLKQKFSSSDDIVKTPVGRLVEELLPHRY